MTAVWLPQVLRSERSPGECCHQSQSRSGRVEHEAVVHLATESVKRGGRHRPRVNNGIAGRAYEATKAFRRVEKPAELPPHVQVIATLVLAVNNVTGGETYSR